MEFNMTDLINIAFAVVAVILTRYLVPFLKNKLEEAGQSSLIDLIEQLVEAAEQIFNWDGSGKEKKAFVIRELSDSGIKVTNTIDNQIEAAVYRMNSSKQKEADSEC